MRCNEQTALSTSKVLLVPYSKHHVLQYHEWMQDPDILAATASEPLTLTQEYAMQQSWRHDPDKLTFIVCHPLASAGTNTGPKQIQAQAHDGSDRMIGDVNMFLSSDSSDASPSAEPPLVGEIELMIAAPEHRGRGFGLAVLSTFLQYIARHHDEIVAAVLSRSQHRDRHDPEYRIRIDHLRAKINQTNAPSIALFRKIGFVSVSGRPNYWGEMEFRLELAALLSSGSEIGYEELVYDDSKDTLEK